MPQYNNERSTNNIFEPLLNSEDLPHDITINFSALDGKASISFDGKTVEFEELNVVGKPNIGGIPFVVFRLGLNETVTGYVEGLNGTIFEFTMSPTQIYFSDTADPYFKAHIQVCDGTLTLDVYSKKGTTYHPDLFIWSLIQTAIERFKFIGVSFDCMENLYIDGDNYLMYWGYREAGEDPELAITKTSDYKMARRIGFNHVFVQEDQTTRKIIATYY